MNIDIHICLHNKRQTAFHHVMYWDRNLKKGKEKVIYLFGMIASQF